MPFTNQSLGCARGDTFAFEIDMQLGPDNVAPNLTGASAQWVLAESWYSGAPVYVTKTDANGGLSISQNVDSVWTITVQLDPIDTQSLQPGTLYHEAKVTLQDGSVAHVTSGDFVLSPSVNP